MKKIISIIIINITSLFVIFLLLDFIAFLFIAKDENYDIDEYFSSIKRKNFEYSQYLKDYDEENSERRKPVGTEYNKKGILTLGCSFAHGSGVNDDETLAARLSEKTKRPAYNLGIPGQSIQHSIIEVRTGKSDNYIKNSDYAIYIFIGDHIKRINGIFPYDTLVSYPIYKKKNGRLLLYKSKIPFISNSYIVYYIKRSFFFRLLKNENKQFINHQFDNLKLHIELLKEELQKINPDIRLIVLVFPDSKNYRRILYNKRWNELEKRGITVVNVRKELPFMFDNEHNKYKYCYVSDKYCVIGSNERGADGHPNAIAWEFVADMLVNKKVIE